MVTLNLNDILKKVLNESVGSDPVIKAIEGHNYVEINYIDEESNAPGVRLIQPYAYGLTTAGNEVLRAFQVSGDTLRGEPAWKFFRLDRIVSWRPRKQVFNTPPPMQGYNVPEYNDNGDGSMTKVFIQADFGDIGVNGLEREKAVTQSIKSAPKISSKNKQGPIPFASQQYKKNVFTSQPNSKKYQQYAQNIKNTENDFNRFDDDIWAKAEAERQQQNAEKMQNTAKQPKQAKQGPIDKKQNNDIDNEKEEWELI